ncbi:MULTISPECIES: hypothetical protein [Rhizobium]|uniref:Uncharacterized protein n=1 Tax=Rhizobium altiplani TaxID=1864509 RepID=A0A109K3C0_9HYPH|nr:MULTISPECIES: hypothetical protein [Rhizobium]KWV59684.1 hypothetical protein AS026_28190 [Rhizobium altiplani]MDQ0561041.1 putative membrane protein [Rhizobium mesoamericanum]
MWPAKSHGTIDEAILKLRAFLMMPHLVYGRLADINIGKLAAMLGGDLAVRLLVALSMPIHLCRHTD